MKSSPAFERDWELTPHDAAAYHDFLVKTVPEPDTVDERTWSDLEMEKSHLRLNQCVTPPGAQYLYALLRNYQSASTLESNVKAHAEFKAKPETAEALRKAMSGMNRRESAGLASFLLGSPPVIPKEHKLFYFLSALAIICPLGIFLNLWFVAISLGLWALNITLYYIYGDRIFRYSPALISVATLLASVPKVSEVIKKADFPERLELQASVPVAGKIRKKISLAFLRREGADDLVKIVIDYLNLLCLFELTALCRAITAVNEERPALLTMFQAVARLDALQSVSGVLAGYPSVCVPEIKSGRDFTLMDVQHPLVNNPVGNTIEGTGNSLLLTGTNMAGKTTFIKTLAVNLLFAQTLGVCLARRAVLPPARVRSLIAREDVIGSGQSYFYFEASELLRMLKDAEQSGREYWFVLDEIFRGTNTIERVAAGCAVLRHLNGCGLVVASTHDHELTKLLSETFDQYHFSEIITGSEARFDYVLRKGPCTTRNAIKLLISAGYPKEVIDLAQKLAAPDGALS